MEEADQEAGNANDASRVTKRAVLTDRDKQLTAYLAIARYLSTAQLMKLVFRETAQDNARKRLLRLGGLWKASSARRTKTGINENFDPPIVRRHAYRTFGGNVVEAWGLTDVGYFVAEQVLNRPVPVPRSDVSANFLEHSVALSGVFVGLVDPLSRACSSCGCATWAKVPGERGGYRCSRGHQPGGETVRAEEIPFHWTTSEFNRLPWLEYDRRSGKRLERIIQPDGVLELGGRRYFLECEMGTHSISGNENKPGATLAKAARYEKYIHGIADPKSGKSSYAVAFPDEMATELLFLVSGTARRKNVSDAIAGWMKAGRKLSVRTLTLEEAGSALLGVEFKRASGRSAEMTISAGELVALRQFYNSVVGSTKRARAAARAAQQPLPEYPAGAEVVGSYLQKLAVGAEGAKDGEA